MASAGTHPGGLSGVLALLFPGRCLGCRARGAILCGDCEAQVPWLGSEVCPLCSVRSRLGRICRSCADGEATLDGARAACRMEGVARQAIHDLKYKGIRDRAGFLADLLAREMERLPLALDVLVPVPLGNVRRRTRGFNQSELIARVLGDRLGVPVEPTLLTRARETPRQVGLSLEERRANIAGAFVAERPESVAGRTIGVLDDVMTTGATLGACADALRATGARRVFGLAVARET